MPATLPDRARIVVIGGGVIGASIAYHLALAGETDVFVAAMHLGAPAPNKVTYATYLGGTGIDENYGVATDGTGNAFVTGYTESADFPTLSAFGSQLGGASDGFVAKIATTDAPAAATVVLLPLLLRMSP